MKIRYDAEKGEWVEKYVLREAGKKYITEEVYAKKKHPYSAPLQYPMDGPMHLLIKGLVTKANVDAIGWMMGDGVEDEVQKAFADKNKEAFKLVVCLAQWVVIAKRFDVKKAVRQEKNETRLGENVMLG